MNKPFIAVSINYRVGVWGFLSTPEIFAEKNANAGLIDQLFALKWVKENIGAFGGDPSRITIWGVSAGAQSIGLHLYSKDEGLFQGAIMESGGPIGAALQELDFYTKPYEALLAKHKCDSGDGKAGLECLRKVPEKQFYDAKMGTLWNPIVGMQ